MTSKTTVAIVAGLCATALALGAMAPPASAQDVRRLPVEEYVSKMKAGWIGQMAGVGWGGPTEFRWLEQIIPEDEMPAWRPELINQFGQDDLYVEMTFLGTLEKHGLNASIRQAGIDFANSEYQLWHANLAGRNNLRMGIAPPDSGHPHFNKCADDIDYQIEADFSGLIAPGMPNEVIRLGEVFGRLMNYGDGLYGGQFVGAMYAEAFFETDMEKVVRAGLRAIPEGSQYHETITDVLNWYRENPDDWTATWQRVEDKYQKNPDYRRFSCNKGAFNIDAKINGAYIVIGLLYGQGDPDQTIIISTRCGQDSDCNPSNAGGILFTSMGFENVPEKFTSALDETGKFSHTPYDWPRLINVCEDLARQALDQNGGRVEKDTDGNEVFVIPVQTPEPTALEQCWEPGPIADSRFTDEELEQIRFLGGGEGPSPVNLNSALFRFAPGWRAVLCGPDMSPGLKEGALGREGVLLTHPLTRTVGCMLYRTVDIPRDEQTVLTLEVGHHPEGDWDLIVRVNGREKMFTTIGPDTATNGWRTVEMDLSEYAGRTIAVELVNQANGWRYEGAYWGRIDISPPTSDE